MASTGRGGRRVFWAVRSFESLFMSQTRQRRIPLTSVTALSYLPKMRHARAITETRDGHMRAPTAPAARRAGRTCLREVTRCARWYREHARHHHDGDGREPRPSRSHCAYLLTMQRLEPPRFCAMPMHTDPRLWRFFTFASSTVPMTTRSASTVASRIAAVSEPFASMMAR